MGFAQESEIDLVFLALRLISLSEIKPKTLRLSVLERSPAMRDKLGERKKQVSHREHRATEKDKNMCLFRLISLSEIKPKLCVSALSSEAGERKKQPLTENTEPQR